MESTIEEVSCPADDVQESPGHVSPAGRPSEKTPQAFYAEITKRGDMREILEALVAG